MTPSRALKGELKVFFLHDFHDFRGDEHLLEFIIIIIIISSRVVEKFVRENNRFINIFV